MYSRKERGDNDKELKAPETSPVTAITKISMWAIESDDTRYNRPYPQYIPDSALVTSLCISQRSDDSRVLFLVRIVNRLYR